MVRIDSESTKMPNIIVKQGDLLDEASDVIVSTANPNLLMSGGVNGAILMRGGHDVQREVQVHLQRIGRKHVVPGTVVITDPGPLACKFLLHAVSINAFYESDEALIAETVSNIFRAAFELGARSLSMPALATGYGPLQVEEFARGLRQGIERFEDSDQLKEIELRIVIWRDADVERVRAILNRAG